MKDIVNLDKARSTLPLFSPTSRPTYDQLKAWCLEAKSLMEAKDRRIRLLESTLETERAELQRLRFIAGPHGRPGW